MLYHEGPSGVRIHAIMGDGAEVHRGDGPLLKTNGRMEEEGWNDGKMEGWKMKDGRMDTWKDGR
jgi:hypothetical protein